MIINKTHVPGRLHINLFHILYFLSISIIFVLLYPQIFEFLLTRALDNLINAVIFLGIIIYFVYKNRHLIQRRISYKQIFFGSILVIAAMIMLYFARGMSGFLLEGTSFLSAGIGIILMLFGINILKFLWIPIIFLAIGFDIFEYILQPLSIYFQLIAAVIAHFILNIIGIFNIQSGTIMDLSYITLIVDPSCNGINHLVALMALALIIIVINRKSHKNNIFLVLFSLFLGFILNGLRIALIGVWAFFFQGDLLHGPGNLFYVTFVFTIGTILLLWVSAKMPSVKNSSSGISATPESTFHKKQFFQAQVITLLFLIFALLLFS